MPTDTSSRPIAASRSTAHNRNVANGVTRKAL
jgi:hypothetical protein